MIALSLQSGSNGNCIFVEAGGVRLLFDAGISGLQAERRLQAHGYDIRRMDGILISHDHSDHVRCAGVFQRKFALPVFVSSGTLAAARRGCDLGALEDVRDFRSGDTLHFGDVVVETIRTPHDAADGVAFVVEAEGRRLGILTDLGHVFQGLSDVIATLDGVFIESNYDPEMLEHGPYPAFLKARIRGPHGHISNDEAAGLLRDAGRRLKWACLAHLSEHNNEPSLALRTHRTIIGHTLPLCAASRYEATGLLEL